MDEMVEYVTIYYVEDGCLVQRFTTLDGPCLIKERIVRCKDCRHFSERDMRDWRTQGHIGTSCVCERDEHVIEVEPDGFCAWGDKSSAPLRVVD